MEKASRRRRSQADVPDENESSGVKSRFSMKGLGFVILVISIVFLLQFVLLTRHLQTDSGSSSEQLTSERSWQRLMAHDSSLIALNNQQKDILRLTAQLSDSLSKQHSELLEVERHLAGAVSEAAKQALELRQQHQENLQSLEQLAVAVDRVEQTQPQAQAPAQAKVPVQADPQAQLDAQVLPTRPQEGFPTFSTASTVQFPSEWLQKFSEVDLRASAVEAEPWLRTTREAFNFAWGGYRDRAFGADEFKPTTGKSGRVWCSCGLQIIDALSTMWVMGLEEEFAKAEAWIETSLHWDYGGTVSIFEITIRALGGLVSAHSLSGHPIFLQKAKELAEKLLPAFEESTGFPAAQITLRDSHPSSGWFQGHVLAEVGTIQLEFRYVSQLTGDDRFATIVDRSMRSAKRAGGNSALVPWGLAYGGPPRVANRHISFGAMGDSYYEYLLKMYVQTDKTEPEWKDTWKLAMAEMENRLIKTTRGGLTYIAEENNGVIDHKMDHLACFVGGMLIYGARQLPSNEVDPRWEETAAGITNTCHEMYIRYPSHLAPEATALNPEGGSGNDMKVWNGAAHYILRPEAAEAIFYMFYYTGDPKYRRMAATILIGIEQHAKTTYGYSAVADVQHASPRLRDEMETFFLAETLKYLYLTFLPNPREVLSLDEFVFNTEAHPIRIHRRKSARFLDQRT